MAGCGRHVFRVEVKKRRIPSLARHEDSGIENEPRAATPRKYGEMAMRGLGRLDLKQARISRLRQLDIRNRNEDRSNTQADRRHILLRNPCAETELSRRFARGLLRMSSAALPTVFKLGKGSGAGVVSVGDHLHRAGVLIPGARLHRNAKMALNTPDLCRRLVIDAFVDRLRPLSAVMPLHHDLRTKVVIADVTVSHGVPD